VVAELHTTSHEITGKLEIDGYLLLRVVVRELVALAEMTTVFTDNKDVF
jgi:hypothetical protein